jgi:phenylacetate-coenzyme A ligase PaaK-like adenylate-forming protein
VTAPWDTRSADEQVRVEAMTLAAWGPAVASAAPFWAERAASLGVASAALVDREALVRLPPARARELLTAAPAGATAVLRPDEGQVKSHASTDVLAEVLRGIRRGGAQGKRDAILREYRPIQLHHADGLLIASTRSDLDRMHRAGARAAAVLGLQDDDVVLGAVPAGPTLESLAVTHLAAAASLPALHVWGASPVVGGTVVPELAAVAALAALQPASVVVVRRQDAAALAETLDEARVDLRRLRRVVTIGPAPDEAAREEVVAAFGRAGATVDVRALWGPAAGRVLWAECAVGCGLHTYPDLELLEVVDPFTGTVTDGDGDLTLTTIGWHGTALLRFQTGAWVDPLDTSPCPSCGRTVPRLVGDVVPDAWELPATGDRGEGTTVDLRGVAAVLATVPGVETWRCELLGPDERGPNDRLVVEVAGQLSSEQRARLADRVAAASGLVPELRTDVVGAEVDRRIDELGGVFADLR